jgi:hypothetical protein
MKKTIILSCVLALTGIIKTKAQTVYVDLLVAPAMIVYAEGLKSEQNEAKSELGLIRDGQALVQGQLQVANNLHNKFLKGLKEVSGVVNNAVVIKRIYETSADIISEVGETAELAAQHPQYAIFASRGVADFRQRAIKLSADVTSVVTGGEANLMDSGERQRLLQNIHLELRLIYITAYGMNNSIRRAIQSGFWRSLNPFARWVNTDAAIMRDILINAAAT